MLAAPHDYYLTRQSLTTQRQPGEALMGFSQPDMQQQMRTPESRITSYLVCVGDHCQKLMQLPAQHTI